MSHIRASFYGTAFIFFAVMSALLFSKDAYALTGAYGFDVLRWEQAQRFRVSGDLELSYRDYTAESAGYKTRQRTFQQRYRLKLKGYIYRPRLAIFEASLSYIKTKDKYDQDVFNTKGIYYGLFAVLLPRTNFPTLLYFDRSTSHLNPSSAPNYQVTTTLVGIVTNWMIRSGMYLSLTAVNTKSDITSPVTPRKENDKFYAVEFSKSYRTGGFRINYQHFDYKDVIIDRREKDHTINIDATQRLAGYTRRNGETHILLSEDFYFTKQDTTQTDTAPIRQKSYYLYITLNIQKKNFETNTYYNFNKYDYNDSKYQSHSITNASTYRPTPTLLLSEGLSFTRASSDNQSSTSYSANLGAAYSRLYKGYSLYAGTSVGYFGASNAPNTFSTNMNAGIATPTFGRKLYYNGYYGISGYYTTAGDNGGRNDLGINFGLRDIGRFSLNGQSSVYYLMTRSKEFATQTGYGGTITGNAYFRAAWFAVLDAHSTYAMGRSDGSEAKSMDVSGGVTLNLIRNLDIRGTARHYNSSTNVGDKYTAKEITGMLNYRFRKLFLDLSYDIYDEQYSDNPKTKRKTIFMAVRREFR